jgi:hypothetical protein
LCNKNRQLEGGLLNSPPKGPPKVPQITKFTILIRYSACDIIIVEEKF